MILLLLDRHSGTPVYRQIVEQVRFQVASGVLEEGQELPSTRALAAHTQVNPMTVSKAYSELEREGVVTRRPGKPHVVAPRPATQAAQARTAELARALAPAVSAARQLGLDSEQALALFSQLLTESHSHAPDDHDRPPANGSPPATDSPATTP